MRKTPLRIHTWPEAILRKKCKKVEAVDDEIRSILDEMHDLMRESDGVGLAATQAGLDLSLVVIEVKNKVFKLINPVVIEQSGIQTFCEGCLSFPGLELEIKRARKIKLSALNEKGEAIQIETEGVLAVVFQHEVDHVNGIVFTDRLSFWGRLLTLPKLRKIAKRTKNGLRKQIGQP